MFINFVAVVVCTIETIALLNVWRTDLALITFAMALINSPFAAKWLRNCLKK